MHNLVDFYASERQYVDHLWPIWCALPARLRGAFYAARHRGGWERAAQLDGPAATRTERSLPAGDLPVVVASWGDALAARGRPVAMVEHGAGQVYVDDDGVASNPGYSGGAQRRMVSLFVCPNAAVAARNLAAVPDAAVAVVGSPRLDRWTARAARSSSGGPVVAVSFHWENGLWPESRTALPEYGPAVVQLARWLRSVGGELVGHAHPRAARAGLVRRVYTKAGARFVDDFDDVLDRADLYVCDNSSTLYEFAATDRPVVVLNASWYRRHVEHGLRFWEHADVGVQVDHGRDLIGGVQLALTDPPNVAERRREVVAAVFGQLDGRAAYRAAVAVAEWAPTAQVTQPPTGHDPFRAQRRHQR